MNFKKNIFSYIIWAACAFLCGLFLVFSLEGAGISEMFGISMTGIVGGVCVYLLFTVAVFFAFRTISREIGRNIHNPQKAEAVLSVILPVIVLIGIVAYLVLYLTYHMPLTLEEDNFYSQALVTGDNPVAFSVHGASWLYTCLLRGMLLIFGNTPFAGVVLQIVLFFICLLLLYIGMQAFTGTIPAVFSMALFGFLPVSFQHIFSLTPELLYLALYLLGFSLTGALYRKYGQKETSSPAWHMDHEGKLSGVLSAIPVFLLGLYIGFLVYLDVYGISLYLFLAVLFSVGKEKIKRAAISYFAAIAGGIGGFFLSVEVVCQIEKTTVVAYLQELYSLYVPNMDFESIFSRFVFFLPDVTLGGSILLISLAFCIIPAFFLWKKSQGSVFTVNLFLVCGLSGLSFFHLDAQMITALAWIMLAGLGVYGVVWAGDVEDSDNARDKAEKETDDESLKEKDELQEIAIPKNAETEEKVASERAKDKGQINENKKTDTDTGIEKKEQKKTAPGKPLHNPLPVPKKKKRAQADFAYQVTEEKMKFDLNVAEEDDFDR